MNNKIDSTEVEVIISGGREDIDRYLVTSVQQLKKSVDAMPGMLAEAVAEHQTSCKQASRKRTAAIASAIGAALGLATPFILKLL